MLIHFVHAGDAYLPELAAYQSFIGSQGHQALLHRSADSVPTDAGVVWWICGRVTPAMARRFTHAFQIHEYASASIPPLASLKDRIKRWSQAVPDYRLYQNAWVRQQLGFADAQPFEYRDMGIAAKFFEPVQPTGAPEFDAVYLGEMRRLHQFLPVFEALEQLQQRVLLVGQVPPDLMTRLAHYPGVHCVGRVAHDQVAQQLRRARYGLNLIPDVLPFSQQTSTKLLEYCAAGLQVISTDYAWVRRFEQQHQARFAYLPAQADAAGLAEVLAQALSQVAAPAPDLHHLAWPHVLRALRLWQRLGVVA